MDGLDLPVEADFMGSILQMREPPVSNPADLDVFQVCHRQLCHHDIALRWHSRLVHNELISKIFDDVRMDQLSATPDRLEGISGPCLRL